MTSVQWVYVCWVVGTQRYSTPCLLETCIVHPVYREHVDVYLYDNGTIGACMLGMQRYSTPCLSDTYIVHPVYREHVDVYLYDKGTMGACILPKSLFFFLGKGCKKNIFKQYKIS